jgi:hypothetical protein
MIQENNYMLDEFSKHFNTRFTSLDYINSVESLVSLINNKTIDQKGINLMLPCESNKVFQQLVDFKYSNLLKEIIKRIKIESESLEIYTSEMQDELVELYQTNLISLASRVNINENPESRNFDINCHELFAELAWSPLSQFHVEVTNQLEYFNELIDMSSKYSGIDNYTANFYINSKVATSFSYFAIAYLAENLKIPLKL